MKDTPDALRGLKAPPPGTRPGLLTEPASQVKLEAAARASVVDSLPTFALPVMAGTAGEAIDSGALFPPLAALDADGRRGGEGGACAWVCRVGAVLGACDLVEPYGSARRTQTGVVCYWHVPRWRFLGWGAWHPPTSSWVPRTAIGHFRALVSAVRVRCLCVACGIHESWILWEMTSGSHSTCSAWLVRQRIHVHLSVHARLKFSRIFDVKVEPRIPRSLLDSSGFSSGHYFKRAARMRQSLVSVTLEEHRIM